MQPSPQSFSHYPAWPAPVQTPLAIVPEHPCVYLPGRMSRTRAILVDRMPADLYHRFMDSGFRRSGRIVYQPACRGCRACVPLRIEVVHFRPDKAQRRCRRRNADLSVTVSPPVSTDEKFGLYQRYLIEWHGRRGEDEPREDFDSFLYESPVPSVEFSYRDETGRLLAVGICDVSEIALSSVYCYFDPAAARRGLGTYAALTELDYASEQELRYYYLGYWIEECAAMSYKTAFQPCQMLGTDGVWRQVPENADLPGP